MGKKKKSDLLEVKITGPLCWYLDRHYEPGETAHVPAEIAQAWIDTQRAVETAEVSHDNRQNNDQS